VSAVAIARALDVRFASDEAVDGPQNLPQTRTSTTVGPFEIMQAQRLARAVSMSRKRPRGRTKGVKLKPEHLRLGEVPMALPVRLLLLAAAFSLLAY
jgi:hypothetical protein